MNRIDYTTRLNVLCAVNNSLNDTLQDWIDELVEELDDPNINRDTIGFVFTWAYHTGVYQALDEIT